MSMYREFKMHHVDCCMHQGKGIHTVNMIHQGKDLEVEQ
jgi:hypothetical protein